MSVAVGADSLARDMPFERGREGWQVQVPVDTAELLGRLDHAGRTPAQCHLAVAPLRGFIVDEAIVGPTDGPGNLGADITMTPSIYHVHAIQTLWLVYGSRGSADEKTCL